MAQRWPWGRQIEVKQIMNRKNEPLNIRLLKYQILYNVHLEINETQIKVK